MLEKISDTELEMMELWHLPRAFIEVLFSNFDNLTEMDEENFGELRTYQQSLISDEILIDFDATAKYYKLGKKETFNLRKTVGDIYNFGGRKFGKSLVTLIFDLLIAMTHFSGCWAAFAAANLNKIRQVLDRVKIVFENHPVLCLWRKSIRSSTSEYKFLLCNNFRLESVNFKIGSKAEGNSDWYGKHVNRVYIEEASLETEEVAKARKDALSELGAVFRISGMTNFTKYSPAGKAFYDLKNEDSVVNLPQMVNPFWDEKEKEDRIREYSGEQSIAYRVFVKGEVVENGVSVFDMERIHKNCYPNDKHKVFIKNFEVNKDNFPMFENSIVVTRPTNADKIYIAGDIGESAGGTEIGIFSETNNKYRYLYNITLFSLTDKEQFKIFKFLIESLSANIVGIDCGEGTGRSIANSLAEIYPNDNIVRYRGTRNVVIGFEKDDKGNVVFKNGNIVPKEERMSQWSIKRLRDLLYEEGKMFLPYDYKLDTQLNQVISQQTNAGILYHCVSENDHLFDMFRVFAIAQWIHEFRNTKNMQKTPWGLGIN